MSVGNGLEKKNQVKTDSVATASYGRVSQLASELTLPVVVFLVRIPPS